MKLVNGLLKLKMTSLMAATESLRIRVDAAWNFHQAAEKAIKAILISEDKDFPRTHDLPRLLTILQLEASASHTVAQAAFILSSFLPLTRYPGDWPEINEARAKEAKEASEIILSWARKHFQQKL